jgi:hypothetical protein
MPFQEEGLHRWSTAPASLLGTIYRVRYTLGYAPVSDIPQFSLDNLVPMYLVRGTIRG